MARKKIVVVVVDDDEAVRDALKFALELEGLRVGLCRTGQELFVHPDLALASCLVLDFKMPDLDGIAVFEGVRARGFQLPAILITGHSTAALKVRAAAAGTHAVLQKPLVGSTLLDAIRAAIRQRRLARTS